ncbi:hypothetical protein ES708_15280 [subsurface metagenome]
MASCMVLTSIFCSLNSIFFPIDFSDATGINSDTGKFLFSKISTIIFPTSPVIPITATFIFLKGIRIIKLSIDLQEVMCMY